MLPLSLLSFSFLSCIDAAPITGATGGIVELSDKPISGLESQSSSSLPAGDWGMTSCHINDLICIQFQTRTAETCEQTAGEWREEPCPPATAGMCLVRASAGSIPVDALVFLYDSNIDTGETSNAELCADLGGTFYP